MQPTRFIISLDLELFWGMRDHRRLEDCRAAIMGGRRAVPAMLALFENYDVKATWATVGILFCENRDELLASLPERRPNYINTSLSPYSHITTIGNDESEDPLHFGLSLIRSIEKSPGQEIASHTFSHYYCCEPGQQAADFGADLDAAVAVAARRGIRMTSLVFPRNQVRNDYLEICRRKGLNVYRGNPPGWLYPTDENPGFRTIRRLGRLIDSFVPLTNAGNISTGPSRTHQCIDVPASRFLRPLAHQSPQLARLQRTRICGEIDQAVRRGGDYHLWWHPHNFGVGLEAHLSELSYILDHMARWRDVGRLVSATMSEASHQDHTIQEKECVTAVL